MNQVQVLWNPLSKTQSYLDSDFSVNVWNFKMLDDDNYIENAVGRKIDVG